MEFTDVPLNEIVSHKHEFKCELLLPSTTQNERNVKVIVTAESLIIKEGISNQIVEEWSFQKIRTWNIANNFFWKNEMIIDLTPYSNLPLVIASDQVLSIAASLKMAIAKRVKEIEEKQEAKPVEFSYTGVQKYAQQTRKKVILEISRVGMRVLEDKSDSVLPFLSPDVLVQKSLLEIKTFNHFEDKITVDFGNLTEKCVFFSKEGEAIINAFKKVVAQKSEGNHISSSSSEDSDA